MNEPRRIGDERLDDILDGIREVRTDMKALARDISDVKITHADLYGRLDQRVLNQQAETLKHSGEISKINDTVNRHDRWINNIRARAAAWGSVFGLVGSVIGYVFEHYIVKGNGTH